MQALRFPDHRAGATELIRKQQLNHLEAEALPMVRAQHSFATFEPVEHDSCSLRPLQSPPDRQLIAQVPQGSELDGVGRQFVQCESYGLGLFRSEHHPRTTDLQMLVRDRLCKELRAYELFEVHAGIRSTQQKAMHSCEGAQPAL